MPSNFVEIQELYGQLVSVMRQQLVGLENDMDNEVMEQNPLEQSQTDERSELALQRFSALSLDWALLAQRVDSLVTELQIDERQRLHGLVSDQLTEMSKLSVILEERLQQIRNLSVDMIGRVKQNRTVLRSYGGLDHIDTTPMYFDEKN